MYKKIMVFVFGLMVCTTMCFAEYNAKYFEQFIGKEVFIVLEQKNSKHNREILIRVSSIDEVNNIVVGKSNEGTYHIDASNIFSIREQRTCISGVYTN
jgi:aminoglycoside N3'-acetyltransferase